MQIEKCKISQSINLIFAFCNLPFAMERSYYLALREIRQLADFVNTS